MQLPPIVIAGVLAATPHAGGGGGVLQSGSTTAGTTASSQTITLTSNSAGSSYVFVWGVVKCSTSGAAVTLSLTDNMSNTWSIDAVIDAGGASAPKAFIAAVPAAAGTKTITLAATGGTITAELAWAEVSGVTGLQQHATHGSSGSAQTSPQVITNSGTNSSANAFVPHVFGVVNFTATGGLAATPGAGTAVPLIVNQDSTGNLPNCWAGYVLDTAIRTDSQSDAWTSGNAPILQAIASYGM